VGHTVVHRNFIKISLIVMSLLLGLSVFSFIHNIKRGREIKKSQEISTVYEQLQNALLAGKIVDYYHMQRSMVDFKDVMQAIVAIDKFDSVIFKERIFDKKDFLALIMAESNFNPRATSYKGAKGLWQVLHVKKYLVEVNGVKDPYDIFCNTKMGMEILRDKYRFHQSKKKSIIAYNGLTYDERGDLNDIYYIKWKKCRDILEAF